MDTQQIVILVVIVLLVLAVLAAILMSMRKRSRADNEARAQQLRAEAHEKVAADLPDAQARAEKAAAEAEQARLAAQRAEAQAAEAHTEVAQQQALHEDQVRAADRLDPRVDHKADDYQPDTTLPSESTSRTSDPDTILDADDRREPLPQGEATREESAAPGGEGGLPRRVRGANQMPGGVPTSEWGDNWFKRNPDGSPQVDAEGNRVPEEGRTDPGTTDPGGGHRA